MKEDDLAVACTSVREDMNTECWSEDLNGRDHLGDLGINGPERNIMRRSGMDRDRAKDRVQWRVLVSTVMKFRIP
jgi:hypothetical protein